jgi:hypothetical protein
VIRGDYVAEVAEDIRARVMDAEDALEHRDELRLRLALHHINDRLRCAAEEQGWPFLCEEAT